MSEPDGGWVASMQPAWTRDFLGDSVAVSLQIQAVRATEQYPMERFVVTGDRDSNKLLEL